VNPPTLTEDSFDVCIRFGRTAGRARDRKVHRPQSEVAVRVCGYLAKHGMPKVPNDLTKHNCIGIRQGEEAYGVWRLASGRGKNAATEVVKIRGN